MFRQNLFAVAACLVAAVQPAVAQGGATYDDWRYFFGAVDGLPDQNCVATTRGGRVSLYLAAAPTGDHSVALYTVLSDPRWNHPGEFVTYRLEFDEFTWTLRARGKGNDFVILWRDVDKYLEFMEDVASRELVSLYTESGTLLANFSLEGSRSATIDLELCVEDFGRTFDGAVPMLNNVESVKSAH